MFQAYHRARSARPWWLWRRLREIRRQGLARETAGQELSLPKTRDYAAGTTRDLPIWKNLLLDRKWREAGTVPPRHSLRPHGSSGLKGAFLRGAAPAGAPLRQP